MALSIPKLYPDSVGRTVGVDGHCNAQKSRLWEKNSLKHQTPLDLLIILCLFHEIELYSQNFIRIAYKTRA